MYKKISDFPFFQKTKMRFFCKNLAQKFAFFLTGFVFFLSGVIFFLSWRGVETLSLLWLIPFFIAIFLGIFFGFLLFISRPLDRIVEQIKRLLGGQPYFRLRPFGNDEVAVITHFFNEITRNIESISSDIREQKKLTTELSIARQIQQDILPKSAPYLSGIDVVARTRSASEVGGDSFDFIPTHNGVLVYIGDVAGHGVSAGLIMAMVNTLMRAFSGAGHTPHEILVKTNEILHGRISTERFMTMALLRWNEAEEKMFFTGAGHEHILIYRAKTQRVETIRTGGIALRMTPDIGHLIEEKYLPLEEEDVVLLYTDGVVDARNARGEMYGLPRLKKALEKNASKKDAEGIFEKITEDFSNFLGDAEQSDDITMLILRRISEEKRPPKKKDHFNNFAKETSVWSW